MEAIMYFCIGHLIALSSFQIAEYFKLRAELKEMEQD